MKNTSEKKLRVALCVMCLGFGSSLVVAQSQPELTDAQIRAKADELIAKMTPEEKAGQLTKIINFTMHGPPPGASHQGGTLRLDRSGVQSGGGESLSKSRHGAVAVEDSAFHSGRYLPRNGYPDACTDCDGGHMEP